MKPINEILNWQIKDKRLPELFELEDLEEVISERELRWKREDELNEERFDNWYNNR